MPEFASLIKEDPTNSDQNGQSDDTSNLSAFTDLEDDFSSDLVSSVLKKGNPEAVNAYERVWAYIGIFHAGL